MKRLGDFLNLESFDLALLEEVRLYRRLGWRRAAGGAGGLQARLEEGSMLRRRTHRPVWDEVQASILTFFLRCGVSRTSST